MLNVEAQAEQQCEYGVHLTGQQEKRRIPHNPVHGFPCRARSLGKIIEIEMFDEMDQHNAADRNAAQYVRDVDTRIGFCRRLVVVHRKWDLGYNEDKDTKTAALRQTANKVFAIAPTISCKKRQGIPAMGNLAVRGKSAITESHRSTARHYPAYGNHVVRLRRLRQTCGSFNMRLIREPT